MSQQPQEYYYDASKDPSYMDQGDISPGNPYNPGPRPPVSTPLRLPQQRERLSRTGAFLRNLFYGNTTPGTNVGNRTAFKRGLIFTVLLALLIATPFVIIGLAKGMALAAVALPALMFALACMFVAGAGMCVYGCCVQFCNRRRRTIEYETTTSTHSFSSTSSVEQEVDDFANERPGASQLSYGQPLPEYTFQPASDARGFKVTSESGRDDVKVNAYDL